MERLNWPAWKRRLDEVIETSQEEEVGVVKEVVKEMVKVVQVVNEVFKVVKEVVKVVIEEVIETFLKEERVKIYMSL